MIIDRIPGAWTTPAFLRLEHGIDDLPPNMYTASRPGSEPRGAEPGRASTTYDKEMW
jgi:hypothetical protein